uniref:Uncharacterized protein n=1 Tax=Sphaerodactylus townsendi TaxID=933632 RepID=A0ACB8F1Y2_9SAUR
MWAISDGKYFDTNYPKGDFDLYAIGAPKGRHRKPDVQCCCAPSHAEERGPASTYHDVCTTVTVFRSTPSGWRWPPGNPGRLS